MRKITKFLMIAALSVLSTGMAWGQNNNTAVTIWSENFDGLAASATPTAPTNSAYTGVTYSCTNGAGTSPGETKIMNEKLAGGASAPELMVGKKGSGTGAAGGYFTAVIPLDGFEGTLTLTYYQNKQSLKVSSTTSGVSGGQTLKPDVGQQTTTFTGITTSMTSITIVFEATTTNNVRLDDIVLTGYKASGSSTTPSITASNVDIAYNATNGSIGYQLQNATGNVTAAVTEGDWLTVDAITASAVSFTCSANTGYTPRTAKVTLSFTGATAKVVTITQAAAPDPSVSADNINIAYNATSGEIAYTVENPAANGSLSVAEDVAWISNAVVNSSENKVTFTCETNEGVVARSGKVTITYTYRTNLTVSKEVTVTQGVDETLGTANNPYTVAQAKAYIDGLNGQTSADGKHVSGIISQVDSYNSNYNSITYWISDDGTTTNQMEVYSGKGINGANFSAVTDVVVGAEVVVKGKLKYFSSQSVYEFDYNNELVSYTAPSVTKPSITFSPNSLSGLTYSEGQGPSAVKTVSVSGQNLTGNISLSLGATSSFEMSLTENGEYTNSLSLTPTSGAVAATTVYVRLKAGLNVGASYSGTITLSSTGASNASVSLSGSVTAYVSPIATLPFSFDDGKNAIATTAGITQEGLGSDYSTGPKLKFDSTGDWILLQFDERPGVLSFDIKGNSFDGGTFTVQTSTDGTTFTNLKAYTSFGTNGNDKLSEKFEALDKDVRYIKWVYTNKSTGNVGLDNISLKKYVAPAPKITLNSYSVEATAEATAGSFVVTYTSIDFDKGIDVVWYTDDTEETIVYSSPEWFYLAFTQDSEPGLTYSISANTGEARAAYFKVHGKDAEDNDVYSGLVTVSQAKYVADYATLPFAFDGGRDDIESTSGLTQESLDTDYSSSPKLKFKATGTYMVLKIKERPGVLKFDIKGNSFSDGTFKVQTSTDGTTYTDLKTYTTLGDTQSEEFDNLGADVRYIKWIYTEKVNGNVALGNISLNPYAAEEFALTAAFCDGRYWATFYSSAADYDLPEDATIYTMNADHQLYQLVVPSEDRPAHMIPAGTAVIIIAESSSITLERNLDSDPEIAKVGTEDVTEFNSILTGSNFAIPVVSVTGTPYVLNIKEGVLGFYPLSQDASIPANKAYYIVSE